ncbi:MAG: hypothetical protein JG773_454 [Spirochaeta sp.]|jgi:hypothetical protein|nr:hypothetical protein [Spirochaeta sp.]
MLVTPAIEAATNVPSLHLLYTIFHSIDVCIHIFSIEATKYEKFKQFPKNF